MPSANTIQHLKRHQIDIQKWDECVARSTNGLIYSNSSYLDIMCNRWDGFVIDNYKCVMALPWKQKAGIRYSYAVPFIQQLGLVGNCEEVSYQDLLSEIKKNFRYGDIFFNYNHLPPLTPLIENTNFVLDMNKTYDELALVFSSDLKKNLKSASKNDLSIANDVPPETAIELFQTHYQRRMSHVPATAYKNFRRLCKELQKKEMVLTRTTVNTKGEILSIALLLKDSKRIYNLMNTTTKVGRDLKANHYLFNEIIREFSGTNLLLDFEGSDLPGVKEFYQNFGPINQPYFHYHFNLLPFPLNQLKK